MNRHVESGKHLIKIEFEVLWFFLGGGGFSFFFFLLEVTCYGPVIRMLFQEVGDLRLEDSYHIFKRLPVKEMGKK